MRHASTDSTLRHARVLIIGIGGLGSPAALALAAAGVGTLGLVDPDAVALSNLHRQPLYDEPDVGRPKIEVAADRLRALHPGVEVVGWRDRFEAELASRLDGFDVVLDGTDSIEAKFTVNDAAVARAVPLVHGGATGTVAQLLTVVPRGAGGCLRCLFEEPPPPGDAPGCQEAGILGPTAALAGALQAGEAIRLITGAPPWFAGRLLTVDTRFATWRRVGVPSRPECPACGAVPRHGAAQRS